MATSKTTTAAIAAFILLASPPAFSSGEPEMSPDDLAILDQLLDAMIDDKLSSKLDITWTCYAGKYDRHKVIFTARTSSDGAYVEVHGERQEATFERIGLDVRFDFGLDAQHEYQPYRLLIKPDGDAFYFHFEGVGIEATSTNYFCSMKRKAKERGS